MSTRTLSWQKNLSRAAAATCYLVLIILPNFREPRILDRSFGEVILLAGLLFVCIFPLVCLSHFLKSPYRERNWTIFAQRVTSLAAGEQKTSWWGRF